MRNRGAVETEAIVGIGIVGLILTIIFLVASFGTVKAGNRGVLLHWGAVTGEPLKEGLYFRNPFVESVVEMNVQTQKEQVQTEAASKDLQIVTTVVAANIKPHPENIATIYQQYGVAYIDTMAAPAMQEAIKSVMSQYTAEELISQREKVRTEIMVLFSEKMKPFGLDVDGMNIVNFNFSGTFNAAIEAKVTAEQHALAAKNKLAQVEFEALQKVAEAKGKAEAMTIESKALRDNPTILQLRAVEKWDGILPKVTGGTVPFISVDSLTK